ncbi:MAG: ATP-dependent sacrificial sulfur transferase LarE [Candidatus Omnitrophica bacterium]|nr:ATP-dependent sacrificial sulfur transferase LarE [Candidatus Omnitrophota bacterium]
MNKLQKLKKIISRFDSCVVAFSGGVDSSFLLKVVRDVLPKNRILAVTAVSDTYTRSELQQAKRFARSIDVIHKVIFTDELKDKNFVKNSIQRCYFCKKELFNNLTGIARRDGFRVCVDASNLDDMRDYRPGSKAKKEFGVKSPLQQAGFTKNDIRLFSKKLNLKTWDLPAMACLASRIPYGEEIHKNTLRKIEKAERFIRALGIDQVRVRYHSDIARIEVRRKDIKRFLKNFFCDKIIRYLKSLGFCYIVLDLEGYRAGSLNERLKQNLAA